MAKIDLKKIQEANLSAIDEGIEYMKYINDIYLDYVNNYLTIEKFANDYACEYETARKFIYIGGVINNSKII